MLILVYVYTVNGAAMAIKVEISIITVLPQKRIKIISIVITCL